MTDLCRRRGADPGLGKAEALRLAMGGMIDGPGKVAGKSGKPVFSYAHPLFWAPFVLVGD
jgi:CHAT domain-containing protein